MRATAWLGLGLVVWAGATATHAEPLKARVKLTNDREWTVELLGRDATGLISLREAGKASEVGLPAREFLQIDFAYDLEASKVDELSGKGEYRAAAQWLGRIVKPAVPYLNLPTNLVVPMLLYLRCLYWDRQYDEVVVTSHLAELINDDPVKRQAQLYRALALLSRGQTRDAEAAFQKVAAPGRNEPAGAIYLYAAARLHLAKQEWLPAQENAARVVAFYPRDFDWLAPALCVSAEAYGRGGQFAVARQITEEIELVFPDSAWSQTARDLRGEILKWQETAATAAPPPEKKP